jgi:hypothetical protein
VYSSKTNQAGFLGRAFLINNDPKPVDESVKKNLKIYPYRPGGVGSSIGSYLQGTGKLGPLSKPVSPKFVEGTDRSMNTIPPADYSYYEMLNQVVQSHPAGAIDPEIAGQFAAIGIVKGKSFNPDARMKKILTEAAAVANAASRATLFSPRPSEGFSYYGGDSKWTNSLFVGGYEFLTPPPEITKEGTAISVMVPASSTTHMVFTHTDHTGHVCASGKMQALSTSRRLRRQRLDMPRHTKSRRRQSLAGRFWSFIATIGHGRCSTRRTIRPAPSAPAAAANADGSIVALSAEPASGISLQLDTDTPAALVHDPALYSPPGPFTKQWRLARSMVKERIRLNQGPRGQQCLGSLHPPRVGVENQTPVTESIGIGAKTLGRLEEGLAEASAKGWTVVDKKKDWKLIYPFEEK